MIELSIETIRQRMDEFATAVRTFDLSVTEQIDVGQNVVGQQRECLAVVLAPVVAIGKLKAVNVPIARWKTVGDQL